MASTERTIWTIAYRKPTGPWFQRVDLELTWHQAVAVAGQLTELRPDLVVWYTTTKACEDAALAAYEADPTDLNRSYAEDAGNVMVDSGKRVAIKDTGKLDPRITIPDAEEAKAEWCKDVI